MFQFQVLLLKLASFVIRYWPLALREGIQLSIGTLARARCDDACHRSEPTSRRRARLSTGPAFALAEAASIRNSGTTSRSRTASGASRR
jgi:hypothetical protein